MKSKIKRSRNRQVSLSNYANSRAFNLWRWLYAVIVLIWTVPFFIVHSLDWGMEVAYYNLFFGVMPAAIFLLLKYWRPNIAFWFAYAYDVFVFLVFVIALVGLPNYMGLFILLPLVGFVCEGIFLTIVLVRR